MEVAEAIFTRRSIRAFEPRPVPRRVLQEVMEIALWTPSFANTQSWEFCMVGGEKLEELRRKLVDAASANSEGTPDLPWPALACPGGVLCHPAPPGGRENPECQGYIQGRPGQTGGVGPVRLGLL